MTFVGLVFIILVVNFERVRLQTYHTFIKRLGKEQRRRVTDPSLSASAEESLSLGFDGADACLEPKESPEILLGSLDVSFGGGSWVCLWLMTSASALLTPVLPMPSEWRIDAGRGMPGLCDFESLPAAAAALSVEGFELSVVEVEVGIKMKSVDSSFGYNMLALG